MSDLLARSPTRTNPHRKGKNVFQIWYENGREVPFLIQKSSWVRDSYFLVTRVEVSPKQLEYFYRTGNMYGKAFGLFYHRGKPQNESRAVELRNSGVFKWRHIMKERLDGSRVGQPSMRHE